jgi:hypothetical protein
MKTLIVKSEISLKDFPTFVERARVSNVKILSVKLKGFEAMEVEAECWLVSQLLIFGHWSSVVPKEEYTKRHVLWH